MRSNLQLIEDTFDPSLLEFDTNAEPLFHEPRSLDEARALVLNADYSPVRYYPLSTYTWWHAIKLVYEDEIDVVATYDNIKVRSPGKEHPVPSVVALRQYVPPPTRVPFTRYNVYLRDDFICAYCRKKFQPSGLTFDHLFPKSRGGRTDWLNIVAACHECNSRKDCKTCDEARMWPRIQPYVPSPHEITAKGRKFPLRYLHSTWADYIYWSSALDP